MKINKDKSSILQSVGLGKLLFEHYLSSAVEHHASNCRQQNMQAIADLETCKRSLAAEHASDRRQRDMQAIAGGDPC